MTFLLWQLDQCLPGWWNLTGEEKASSSLLAWFLCSQPELVSSAIGSFKKDFIYICVYVYASVWMYVTCVQTPTEVRKDHWVQWLGAAQHGWWELKSGPLEKQQILLTIELSLQPQQDFTVSCQRSLKAMAIACAVWGAFRAPLINNSHGGLSHPALGFLLSNL